MRGSCRIAAGLLLALVVAGGCYYRKYDPLVRTHVDLMVAMAEKRADLARRQAKPPNPAEFLYPLERGRDFARIVRDSFGERESFRAFEAFLERYAESLKLDADADRLAGEAAALRQVGKAVIAALDRERLEARFL